MAEVLIGGDAFRVEIEGDPGKPPLLLSNSIGVDLSMWDPQMPALLRRFRVIRYDSRGHGGSALGATPFSIARLGQDALGILDALDIAQAHFLGLSMGGVVGQWLLVNAPHRIARAVLANTAAQIGTPEMWNARIAIIHSGDLETLASAMVERWFSAAFTARHPDVTDKFHRMLRAAPPRGYAACCAALRDMDLRSAIRVVTNPVLYISGTADPVTSPQAVADMLDAMPHATHVALKCRHMSAVEVAPAFGRAVIAFLTSETDTSRRAPSVAKPKGRATPAARAARRMAGRPAGTVRRPVEGTSKAASRAKPAVAGAAPAGATARSGKGAAKASKRAAKPTPGAAERATARARMPTATASKRKAVASKDTAAKATPAKSATAKSTAAKAAASKSTATKAKPAKATGSRRPTPTASARVGTPVAAKKASAPKVKRSPRQAPSGGKLPTPRRKTPVPSRRPKGRGKP